VKLLAVRRVATRSAALKLETAVKRLERSQKLLWAAGRFRVKGRGK
jgi:predicted GIY-YIG superfamily endonuclease